MIQSNLCALQFDVWGMYYRRVNALLYLNEGWKDEW
jgi:hypothetical protein